MISWLRVGDGVHQDQVSGKTLVETGLITSGVKNSAHRTYTCTISSGPNAGHKIAIGGRPVVVGTQGSCDLRLSDPKVSRRHLTLEATTEGLRIKDQGSSNGTFADSVRVTDAIKPVSGGQVVSIRCGDTVLRVRPASAPSVPPSKRNRFGGLVGQSVAMREIFAVLELASPTEATVLLQGESGTGKELAARAIHDHSARASGPFEVLDCSAINAQLLDSHLFGHRRGAFTGAVDDRRGAFVKANKGTLFIDELGELPLESQAKLLRVLEARTVQPLGSDERTSVDTRVIAATHVDLAAMVEQGRFRFDLFHRLAVVHIHLPALRERLDDLPELIGSFYEGRGVSPGPVSGEPLQTLQQHSWPGNVRELRNLLERSWVLSGAVPFSQLQIWFQPASAPAGEVLDVSLPFKEAKQRVIQGFERRYLAAVLHQYQDNLSQAAEHAGVNRRHFRKLLEEHGLKPR